jgi:hypothetical protein
MISLFALHGGEFGGGGEGKELGNTMTRGSILNRGNKYPCTLAVFFLTPKHFCEYPTEKSKKMEFCHI